MAFQVPIRKIVELAAKAEDAGIAYYQRIAGLSKDDKVKQLCLFFAEQEREHKAIFEKMAKEIRKDAVGNFNADIVSLLNQGIHKLKETGFQSSDFDYGKMSVDQCLELALHLELASVAIYEEVRKEMDTNSNVTLYKIIHEENGHAESIQHVIEQSDPKRKKQPRVAKIVRPDKIVIQRREVLPSPQDYLFVLVLFLILTGIILAMVGPRYISEILDAVFVN